MTPLKFKMFSVALVTAFGLAATAGATAGATAEATAAGEAEVGELTVAIAGFGSDRGNVKIALASSPEEFSFESKPVRLVTGELRDGKSQWVFSELPFGEYAIKIYHDENINDELDKNVLGIPKEGVGFSNNASARFGEPGYDDAKFSFDSPSMTVDIKVQ